MITKIKSALGWMWKRIKKHPFLGIASIIGLGLIAYYIILPAIAITAFSVGIVATTCVILGSVVGGFLGWLGQKIGLIKPDPFPFVPIPPPEKKFENFLKLPAALQLSVAHHAKNLKDFAETSRAINQLSRPLLRVVKFLRHVAHGEREKAKAMLDEEAEHSRPGGDTKEEKQAFLSRLLTTPRRTTNASGQIFTGTAIQYALQAKNWPMWDMLIKYFPEQQAFEQSHAKFLQHIAHGEQDEAEDMLKKEKPHNLLKLLTTAGTATDLSGRTFSNVTALKLAFWAKDRHMWQMLQKYLSPKEMLKQYEEHEEQGVSYELEGKKIINEKHFNFSPLINALEKYVDYMRNYSFSTWAVADRLWLEVGRAQRYVPAHVAHEYLREDRSFTPLPSFKEKKLLRTLHFLNLISTSQHSSCFFDTGLGFSFSISRGKRRAVGWRPMWLAKVLYPSRPRGPGMEYLDLAAVRHLYEVRTDEYDALPQTLNASLGSADDLTIATDAPVSFTAASSSARRLSS